MAKYCVLFILLLVSIQINAQVPDGFATFNPIIESPTYRSNSRNSELLKKECVARYKTQRGWSGNYTVEVNFITGNALNEATGTLKYSNISIYGIIFWKENQASVIKITTFLPCAGLGINENCLNNVLGPIEGKDQDGDYWRIYTN